MEGRISTHPARRNDGLDPTLFALATILPMSCFPIDNVHPSERYGPPEIKPHRIRKVAKHSKKSRTHPLSTTLKIQNQYCSKYRADYDDLFDFMPQMSVSTASSDWTSNWSYSEPVAHFGSAELPDYLLDGLNLFPQGRADDSWDESASSNFAYEQPPHLESIESCAPCDILSSNLPMDRSDGESSETYSRFQDAFLLAGAVASPSKPWPQKPTFPDWTGLLSPDHSSHQIDQEVDDFLQELSNVIDWDNVALGSDEHHDHHGHETDSSLSRYTNKTDEDTLIPSLDLYQGQAVDRRSSPLHSPDNWVEDFLDEDIESSSVFSALLEECYPFLPHSDTYNL